jgi:hypothetical protein
MARKNVTWFVCRSLGRSVWQALADAGELVHHHDDHFASDAPDEDWLPIVAEHRWVALTKDKQIRLRFHERQSLLVAGGCAFFLSGGNLPGAEQARRFVSAVPRMKALLATTRAPFLGIVTATTTTILKPRKRHR